MACSSSSSHDNGRPDVKSIQAVVASIDHHMREFLEDDKTRISAKLKCTSKLTVQKREFFEFSEQSILSNLYWGIESIEAAILSNFPEEKSSRLANSERMLQSPALLDEHGVTAGISNRYLVCCSYFYLSVVQKLKGDRWQVALHFLQAVMVSPSLVWREFAPNLCNSLFVSCFTSESQEMRGATATRSMDSASLMKFDEGEIIEAIRHMASSCKAWLTYYQVMSYGETPQRHSGGRDIASTAYALQSFMNRKSTGTETSNLQECGNNFPGYYYSEKVHPLDPQEYITTHNIAEDSKVSDVMEFGVHIEALTDFNQVQSREVTRSSNIKCLQDLLIEPQSDASISDSSCGSGSAHENECEVISTETDHIAQVYTDYSETQKKTVIKADYPQHEISDQKQVAPCFTSSPEFETSVHQAPGNLKHDEGNEGYINNLFSGHRSSSALELHTLKTREERTTRRLFQHDLHIFDHVTSTALKNYWYTQMGRQGGTKRSKKSKYFHNNPNGIIVDPGKGSQVEPIAILEKVISKLLFSEGLGGCDEDYAEEVVRMYDMLSNRRGVKYTLLKDIILDQLLTAITSKEVRVTRASISILSTLASGNKTVIDDIHKNGLQLCNLASALKRNVHEAAILIYLTNPPPAEIQALELLPTLVEVVCTSNSYKGGLASLVPTPPVASLMIIEVLVTAFDCATNNMHLAAINTPRILSKLLDVPRNNNLEDLTSLTNILVRCMRFDGQCRKYVSKSTPMAPFVSLLKSNQERTKLVALEFFHEILRMPRSSATNILQQIQKEEGINNTQLLLPLIQQPQPDYKLLAANLLLQLDILEDSPGKITCREEAVETLLKPLSCEENSSTQQLSAFLLANVGGTFAWTGEPYTVAWLLKMTGLTTQNHLNIIRNFNWLDQSLVDPGTDTWCKKIARGVTKIGKPVFHALEKGLKSKTKKVSQDCLTAIAWVGCGIARTPDNLRYAACEILLSTVEQFLHPGMELEERLLACLCIYNYASGKGMQKLIHFSEGVRESLRRLSNITWMAEELLRVADYFLPDKWRISCVHTQILEARQKYNGAVTALIYYKGQLCSGYADGSIKVWDINGQTATLVLDMKEHKKAVTCFSLFQPGDCMMSGSADKTIRIWQMVQRKLECIEVIGMKEPIGSLDTYGQLIFAITKSHEMKVFDSSRATRDICKAKQVKCVRVIPGKAYVGCMDSSIQELAITTNREREIKAPSKSWRIKSRPINVISVYKDWLYSASAVVEGSNIKEWRRQGKPQICIMPARGINVLAMEVVEDFIYLNCSSSASILQIWLRGTQQKVGRISAGSKITCLLTGNDLVLCGTEKGIIKGWIPL